VALLVLVAAVSVETTATLPAQGQPTQVVAVEVVVLKQLALAAPVLSLSVLHARTHLSLVQPRSVTQQRARTQVVVQRTLITRSTRLAR
jgi:hypothetical protein